MPRLKNVLQNPRRNTKGSPGSGKRELVASRDSGSLLTDEGDFPLLVGPESRQTALETSHAAVLSCAKTPPCGPGAFGPCVRREPSAHDREGHYVAPVKSGINKDAMTMQECRERLAAPVKDRPPSEDGIDIDAMCRNMLSASKTWTTRKPAARSVSAPSQAASR